MTSKEVVQKSTSSRQFHAYCVGLARTGTTSIAAIFGRYRSEHDFMFEETMAQIAAWQEGQISPELFEEFILERDEQGQLELDSACFNHHYLHIFIKNFQQAKYIFTVRDCYSWLNSVLNMGLRYADGIPDWMLMFRRYSKFYIGYEIDSLAVSSRQAMLQEMPKVIDGLLSYWQKSNQRILDLLPPERSLIVPTHKLSQSLEQIANLVGVTPESLIEEAKHSNQAPPGYDWLKYIDQDLLEERCSFYCGSLMERLFPDLMEVRRN
ncbi:sulfotransferase [Microseira wollei]|nr:sulfotransferase [Microseira wollei]